MLSGFRVLSSNENGGFLSYAHLFFFETGFLGLSLGVHDLILLGLKPLHLFVVPLTQLFLKPTKRFSPND